MGAFEPDADEAEAARAGDLEAVVGADERFEERGQSHVLADVGAEAFDAVVAEDEPEFEGAEAASERDLPIAVIDDLAGGAGLVAEVLGGDGEGGVEGGAVAGPEERAIEVGQQPLVRVEVEGVGAFDALDHGAELGADHGGAGVGGVDVQPDGAGRRVIGGALREAVDGIDGAGAGGADGGADKEGAQASGEVVADLDAQGLGVHGEGGVARDEADVAPADARDHGGLDDGGVRLGRGVGDEGGVAEGAVGGGSLRGGTEGVEPAGAGGDHGGEDGLAGGAEDHAAPWAGGGGAGLAKEEIGGQADHGAEPVGDAHFELGDAGGALPEEAVDPEAGGEELAQDGGPAVVAGEVGVEVRALPVGDAREDVVLKVLPDGGPGLAVLGRGGGEGIEDVARGDLSHDGPGLDGLQVVGDPIHQLVARGSELLWAHVLDGGGHAGKSMGRWPGRGGGGGGDEAGRWGRCWLGEGGRWLGRRRGVGVAGILPLPVARRPWVFQSEAGPLSMTRFLPR